jgi:hypothetical protein
LLHSEHGTIEYESPASTVRWCSCWAYKLDKTSRRRSRPSRAEDFTLTRTVRHHEVLQSRHIAARCEVEAFGPAGLFSIKSSARWRANITNSIRYAHQTSCRAWEEQGVLCWPHQTTAERYPPGWPGNQTMSA